MEISRRNIYCSPRTLIFPMTFIDIARAYSVLQVPVSVYTQTKNDTFTHAINNTKRNNIIHCSVVFTFLFHLGLFCCRRPPAGVTVMIIESGCSVCCCCSFPSMILIIPPRHPQGRRQIWTAGDKPRGQQLRHVPRRIVTRQQVPLQCIHKIRQGQCGAT